MPPSPLLQMHEIRKSYPGVQALRGVSLSVQAGEVLALVGENGAGKSTLIKILGGSVVPDSGKVLLNGQPLPSFSPHGAAQAGIAVIHQEFNLVPALSARENIFLGQEPSPLGVIARSAEYRQAKETLARLGLDFDPETPVSRLSVAQQQGVEIARALIKQSKVLVLDEPTAPLTPHEVRRLLAIIAELRSQGLGIIYISHRLEEVFQIADRITVLRDGAEVVTRSTAEFSRAELIENMVGRNLETEFPARHVTPGPVRLELRNFGRQGVVENINLRVHQGEIVALTGLVGSGRTELARLIFGAEQANQGELWLNGQLVQIRSPRAAIARGICLLTEDRKHQGLILNHSVIENFALPSLPRLSTRGWLKLGEIGRRFAEYTQRLRIKIPGEWEQARNLSGGNQQKVVLAKWLQANSEVLIFDEPTRGIDVGAKFEIYQLMNELAAAGKAILMISSELPEVLGMADRILVMHAGRLAGEIADARKATQQQIMELAVA